jgi:threonine/homoserine/homoserine lactone efflux protein
VGALLWLGVVLGLGAALSVGPVSVTIISESAIRGFGAAVRIILGSATADVLLLVPALAFSWLIGFVAGANRWIGLIGAVFFGYLAIGAIRDARRLLRGAELPQPVGWAYGKGVLANLANPLAWMFWLVTGTPAMHQARAVGGWPGVLLFTVTWFVVASGVEMVVSFAVARSRRLIGRRGLAGFGFASGALFLGLAGIFLGRDVLSSLG